MIIRSLVGYTSSQKQIYQYTRKDYVHLIQSVPEFSDEDYFDAMAIFSYLQLLYWRKYGEYSKEHEDGLFMVIYLPLKGKGFHGKARRLLPCIF
jgi:hypothetical protein